MKFCQKCGCQLVDEAVICVNCGCQVQPVKKQGDKIQVALIFGVLGIIFSFIYVLVGHICSIVGIVFGIVECSKNDKTAGLVLSIVGEICAIFSSVVGVLFMSEIFYYL